jgi:asparagine synthase (glutamine-hydrolysing)
MCGINGIYSYAAGSPPPRREELIATRDAMIKRGPDGSGEWWSGNSRLGLGHRRLAIIDLSDRAAQPMASACGRYQIVFNGEIYNHSSLRRELEAEGRVFRTGSDTEVLLHLFARDGKAMLKRLRGMFSFGLWDDVEESLFVARDPYGIKPLYISDTGGVFRFASQVKALLAGGGLSKQPDPAGIVGFYLLGSVPEPFTIWRDIRALPAGACQTIDKDGIQPPRLYCRLPEIFADTTLPVHPDDQRGASREALTDSVRAHLVADVEVGLFLSAGIDSSALLGLMRDCGQSRIRAITLAFDDYNDTIEDEAPLAAEIARQYGADHVVKRVSRAEFEEDRLSILASMDQPTIDGVNTWFVAKAAAEVGLKVAISGVGGDELFAGYPSFNQVPRMSSLLRWPAAVPGLAAGIRLFGKASGVVRRRPKLLGLLEYGGSFAGAYFLRRALFLPFELQEVLDHDVLTQGLEELNIIGRLEADALSPLPGSPCVRVASLESCAYLRNQLLRDSDWAGMAHSLEIRTPLVDIELLRALVPQIPSFAAEGGKASLAAAPRRPLPTKTVNRVKTGFSVPIGQWTADVAGSIEASKGEASRAWGAHVMGAFLRDAS